MTTTELPVLPHTRPRVDHQSLSHFVSSSLNRNVSSYSHPHAHPTAPPPLGGSQHAPPCPRRRGPRSSRLPTIRPTDLPAEVGDRWRRSAQRAPTRRLRVRTASTRVRALTTRQDMDTGMAMATMPTGMVMGIPLMATDTSTRGGTRRTPPTRRTARIRRAADGAAARANMDAGHWPRD